MLGRGVKLASGVEVPVFLRGQCGRRTGAGTTSFEARLVSASVKMLLTSALPLLLTTS